MKRQITISLIILEFFITTITFGQNYFNKSIPIVNSQAALSIQELSGGGYLIVGQNYKSLMQTLYFMRVDSNGDTLWTKEYGSPLNYYWVSYSSLNATSDGNYICAGTIQDTTSNSDALLVKFTINGDTIWTKKFGGPYYDGGRDCQQTVDGGYMLIVDSDSLNNGKNDFVLIKTDSLGDIEWKRRYDAGDYDVPSCGFQTQDKGYIISGGRDLSATSTSNWIVKTDSIGLMEWNKTYGSGWNDGLCWITQLANGKYITTGAKNVSGMAKQACMRMLNIDGTLDWEKNYGGISDDVFLFHVNELSESYVIAGNFLNIHGKYEANILKTDTLGNQIWERQFAFNPLVNNYVCDIKRTSDNGFIISGQTVDISGDIWLVKVDSNGCETSNCNVGIIEDNLKDSMLKVYPNPALVEINISIGNENLNDYEITVLNTLGEKVQKIRSNQSTISLSGFSTGVYFISAISKDGSKRYMRKIVKG